MTLDKIKGIIAEQLGVDEDAVKMETHLMKDLEADSLDAVEIIMRSKTNSISKCRMKMLKNSRL